VGFKQMSRRRNINADPGGRSLRFLRGAADVLRWPFERVAWAIEERLLWPLGERLAGWSPPGRLVGAGALASIAAAAVLAGVLLMPEGDSPREQVAAPTRVAIAPAESQQQTESQEPALQGVPPSFGVGGGVGVSAAGGAGAETDTESSEETPLASEEAAQSEEGAAATTSSRKPVPAGSAAMKVARRFSEAFLFYEIGERPARAKTVFGETATPELATALSERPPRLPADAEVPKARVVNLLPGPRAGKAYTVSVSMLRLGLTSELRLELNRQQGAWVVTDVRG
jgi:hypothetical protein